MHDRKERASTRIGGVQEITFGNMRAKSVPALPEACLQHGLEPAWSPIEGAPRLGAPRLQKTSFFLRKSGTRRALPRILDVFRGS